MPHSLDLNKKISEQVKLDYPFGSFVFDKSLAGTRIRPDIQVFGKDNTLECVVEIGYTRPEKLKIYKSKKIKDIRWYSKEGRLIGCEFIKEEEEVRDVYIQPFYSVSYFESEINGCGEYFLECPFCRDPGCDCRNDDDVDCPHRKDDEDIDDFMSCEECIEEREAEATEAVSVVFYFDDNLILAIGFCDFCGNFFILNEEDVYLFFDYSLKPDQEFINKILYRFKLSSREQTTFKDLAWYCFFDLNFNLTPDHFLDIQSIQKRYV